MLFKKLRTDRRYLTFRQNRRAYIAFWVLSALFFATLGAELIANDRPLIARYKGGFYFPVLVSYPETAFGEEFAIEADF
ncbi:MAG: ABC transporter permease, partial [Bdellovibrio sp.]